MQERLKEELLSKEIRHSIILCGPRGSGKHEVCQSVANKLKTDLIDITDNLNDDYINNIYTETNLIVYLVDIDKCTVNKQNTLLKIFEEPPELAYFILICENINSVIETLLSRGTVYVLDKFDFNYLSALITNDEKELTLQVCDTPGQVETANHTDMTVLKELCCNMITKMKQANLQNAISISNKINFKDDYDKFDLYLFIKVMEQIALNMNSLSLYLGTLQMNIDIWKMNNKKSFFENYLVKEWDNAN